MKRLLKNILVNLLIVAIILSIVSLNKIDVFAANARDGYSAGEVDMILSLFDYDYYRRSNPDLVNAYGDNKDQYINHLFAYGINEGRKWSSFYDNDYYLNRYSDLKQAYGNVPKELLKHYLVYGFNEGRQASSNPNTNMTTIPKPANILTNISGDKCIVFGKTNYVVDVQGISQDNGGGVCIWERNAGDNQVFQFVKQSDGSYEIIAKHSSKALEIGNNDKSHNAKVQQWDFNGLFDCKKWWIVDTFDGDGTVYIINKYSGLYLDLNDGITQNGNLVHVWEKTSGYTQKWTIVTPFAPSPPTTISNPINTQITNASTNAIWPTVGGTITQYDTSRHSTSTFTYNGQRVLGHAIDIAVPIGTNVYATKSGTVYRVADLGNKSFGKYIYLKHDDGTWSAYCHLSSFLVNQGERVNQGQLIAKSGNSGGSTGPHLHFEITDGKFPTK